MKKLNILKLETFQIQVLEEKAKRRIRLLKVIHNYHLENLEKADYVRSQGIAKIITPLVRRINPKTKVKVKINQLTIFENEKGLQNNITVLANGAGEG